MSTTGGKATLANLEKGGTFTFQYNPKEFKVDKAVSWKEHDDQGQNAGLEYQKGAPMVVSLDAYFDTTNESNSDVRQKWVNGLLNLTNPEVNPGEGLEKKRPPKLQFSWGSFSMTCVIESVNTTYLMFGPDGTPIRARVSLKMKEWVADKFAKGSGGAAIGNEKVKLVSSSSKATASQVAQNNGVSTQQLLKDNPQIEDPLEVPAGTEVVINKGEESTTTTSNRGGSSGGGPISEIKDALKEIKDRKSVV